MKKLTRKYIRKLITEELSSGLVQEGEDAPEDLFSDEPAEEAEEGGDEAEEGGEAEADTDEGAGEGADEAEEGEEEAGDDKDDSKDEKEDDTEATGPNDYGIDKEINAVMLDFEQEALDVADAMKEAKSSRLSIKRYLLESEEEQELDIDVDSFAQNVARLIGNYDNLIDMEQVIFNKAVQFLKDKYGDAAAMDLQDSLEAQYDITFKHQFDPEKESTPVYAVGAANAE